MSFTAKRKVKKLDTVLTNAEYIAEPSKGTVLFLEDPSGYLVFERDFTSTFITPFKGVSDKVLSDNVLTVLLAKETLFRARKVEVPEMSKLSAAVSKMVDRIVEYRTLQEKLTSIAHDTHIQNAVMNVLAKIVRYATPSSHQAQDNLNELISHIILKVLSRESIKTSVTSEIVYEQLPRQLFLGSQERISSGENCELQIDSIQKLFLFLAELKIRIGQMPGIKYAVVNKKRGTSDTRYATTEWKKVQESFYSVIDKQCIVFVEKLLYRRQKSITESSEIITLGNGKRVFVGEMIGELLIQMRDTYEPAYSHGYVLLVETLLLGATYPETNGPIMVTHFNHLINLERKMRISLESTKATLLKRIVETIPEIVPKGKTAIEKEVERILSQLDEIVDIQEQSQVQATPKNQTPQLQFNLADFLLTQVAITPVDPDTTTILESITKRTGNYNQVVYKALDALHKSRGAAIPVSVYKNFSTKAYTPLFIAFFTGFFMGYADTYTPRYSKNLHEATMDSLEEWYKTLTDKGTFFKAHVTFVYKMINLGLMGFNPRSGLVELTQDAVEKYQDTVEKYKKPVVDAFKRILEPSVDYPRAPIEVCKHTRLTAEIADLQDFTDGDTPEISALQNELAECHVVTPESIICKYCGEKLNTILSTVETFDDYTDQALHNQISGTLQVQTAEAETDERNTFIENTIDSVLKYYKLSVVAQLNELDEDTSSTISEREKQTSIQTIQSIISGKYTFKNMATKMAKQTTQNIRIITLETQILYDTIKMMLLLLFGKGLSPRDYQKGFVAIPSTKQLVPTSVYTLDTELNYIRTIYNFAINLIADQVGSNYFSSDDEIITEKNVYDVPNTFGFDVHASRQEVQQLLAAVSKTRKAHKKTSTTVEADIVEDIYPLYISAYTNALQRVSKPANGSLDLVATGVPILIEKESFLARYQNSNFRIKTQMSGYLNRQIETIQQSVQILSLFKLLTVDVADILSGSDVNINIFNNILTVESSAGMVHSPIKISKAVSIFMGTGITSTRLFLIEQLFKNKLVLQHVTTSMKLYYSTLGAQLLSGYNELLKTYKSIQSNITETPMYLCPYCDVTSDRVSTIKTHIHHTHDNVYLSDTTLRNGFKIIPPRNNDCSYCDYHGSGTTNVLNHIKSEHLEIKQSQSAMEETTHMKYLVHIDKLVKNYTIHQHGNAIHLNHSPHAVNDTVSTIDLDNYVNQHLLYRQFCDSHIGSAHTYDDETTACIFCNRTAETIEQDASNFTSSRVPTHAKNLSDFVRKVIKSHSIKSASNKLRDDHTLPSKATLEDLSPKIDDLRHLTDISYETCKYVLGRVRMYREDVRRMYSSSDKTPFDMLTITEVDSINDNYTVSTVPIVLYDPEYIKLTKLQFPNLSDGLLTKIFSTKDIIQLDTKAKTSTDAKEVRELRHEISEEFAKNAYDQFLTYSKYDNTQELADTLSTITGEPSIVIKKNIRAIKGQKELPRKIIKQLTLLVAGKKDSYRDRAYLI